MKVFNISWIAMSFLHILLVFGDMYILNKMCNKEDITILEGIFFVLALFAIFSYSITPELSLMTPFIKWKKKIDGDSVPNDLFNKIFREEDIIEYEKKIKFVYEIENAQTLEQLEEIDKKICEGNKLWNPRFLGGIYGLPVKPTKIWIKYKDITIGKNNFDLPEDTLIINLIINQYKKLLTT